MCYDIYVYNKGGILMRKLILLSLASLLLIGCSLGKTDLDKFEDKVSDELDKMQEDIDELGLFEDEKEYGEFVRSNYEYEVGNYDFTDYDGDVYYAEIHEGRDYSTKFMFTDKDSKVINRAIKITTYDIENWIDKITDAVMGEGANIYVYKDKERNAVIEDIVFYEITTEELQSKAFINSPNTHGHLMSLDKQEEIALKTSKGVFKKVNIEDFTLDRPHKK